MTPPYGPVLLVTSTDLQEDPLGKIQPPKFPSRPGSRRRKPRTPR